MKSLQTFRTLRSSRDLFKNDVLGSYFKNRVPYPPLISKKTENSGSPTTRKTLEKQWILPVLGKICARYGQDPFKGLPRGYPADLVGSTKIRNSISKKHITVRFFWSDCRTPCFLGQVFCQELEKTGFRFIRDRESDEIHRFPLVYVAISPPDLGKCHFWTHFQKGATS